MDWKKASYVETSGLRNVMFADFRPRSRWSRVTAADTRDNSSEAALRVKVSPRIFSGLTPCSISVMMRLVIV